MVEELVERVKQLAREYGPPGVSYTVLAWGVEEDPLDRLERIAEEYGVADRLSELVIRTARILDSYERPRVGAGEAIAFLAAYRLSRVLLHRDVADAFKMLELGVASTSVLNRRLDRAMLDGKLLYIYNPHYLARLATLAANLQKKITGGGKVYLRLDLKWLLRLYMIVFPPEMLQDTINWLWSQTEKEMNTTRCEKPSIVVTINEYNRRMRMANLIADIECKQPQTTHITLDTVYYNTHPDPHWEHWNRTLTRYNHYTTSWITLNNQTGRKTQP